MHSPSHKYARLAAASHAAGIDAPLYMFDLESMGIDRAAFLRELMPTFEGLTWDPYDVRRMQMDFLQTHLPEARARLDAFYPGFFAGHHALSEIDDLLGRLSAVDRAYVEVEIQPCRKRSLARFRLTPHGTRWGVERQPVTEFVQRTPDYRSMKRVFQPMRDEVCSSPMFQELVQRIADMARAVDGRERALEMTVHQASLVARPGAPADNSPEGIHQDGVDYLVSALVVERRNVQGGESRIFAEDKRTCLFRTTLQQGQGLFQADRNTGLWHDVTPVYVEPSGDGALGEGVRNIFGFDVNVLE